MADTEDSGVANAVDPSFEQFLQSWKLQGKKKVPPPPKPKPASLLAPLTEAEWASMEGKARWDSIVALRGPDMKGSDVLKWFTSSVIRGRLREVMRVGGLVNTSLPFVVLPTGGFHFDGRFDSAHFIGHIYEAANWLHIPVVYVTAAPYQAIVTSGRHPYEAEVSLYPHFPEGSYKDTLKSVIASRGYAIPAETTAPQTTSQSGTTMEDFS